MTHHTLPAERRTVHGPFNGHRPPTLMIDAGDTVTFSTMDAGWGGVGEEVFGVPRPFVPEPERDLGHALTGPVFVRGAMPGDVLEVRIDRLRPGPWGSTWGGPQQGFHRAIGVESEAVIHWRIDVDAGTATDIGDLGLRIPIRPFMGVMGNCPAGEGDHATGPPRRVGGNIDCRELVEGSVLWLPIEVEGALLSMGDGHAAQGDGEISQTAIECPMEEVTLTFDVRRDLPISYPCAMTPAGFITIGIGETLDGAIPSALGPMLDYLEREQRLTRAQALILASLVVSVRVTQLVNGTVGIHAILPPNAFDRLPQSQR